MINEKKDQTKIASGASRYKMIPVDLQTYEKLVMVCQMQGRKQGAQVKIWVDNEYKKLPQAETDIQVKE